jgi:hypothetical protein
VGQRDPDLCLVGDDPRGGPVTPETVVGAEAERGGAVELWPLRYQSVLVWRQQGRVLGALPRRLADRHPVERLWVLLSLRSGPVLLPSPNLNGSKHMTEVCKFPRSARSKFSPKKEHKRITNHPRR